MRTVFTLARKADGLIDYVFDTLTEAVEYCAENDVDEEAYRIEKTLEDGTGCEAECLDIYSLSGDKIDEYEKKVNG